MSVNEKLTVNDGNGLYDNEGLCDSLISDVNELTKALVSGQYVRYASLTVQMVQKLANLKNGIRRDIASRDERIRELTNGKKGNDDGAV